jgi:outer membrane protein assembly factor BamA
MTPAARFAALCFCALAPSGVSARQSAQPAGEVIAAVRVHGNHTTPDEDVIRLAAITVGQPVTAATVEDIGRRLRESGRFKAVEIRKRYTSLSDPSAVLIVILIEERAGISIDDPTPGTLRRLKAGTMWMPVLRYDDGYGFSYGARFAFPDLVGRHTRVTVPLVWGGERRATVAVERTFERGPFSRIVFEGGATRRENPAFDTGDRRAGVEARAERAFTPWLRASGGAGVQDVAFGSADDRVRRVGADVVLDTRTDPAMPRNAVFVRAGVERLWFDASEPVTRPALDLRGYLGLPGKSVLAARAQFSGASGTLPPWERALLGGADTVRGFDLGFRSDDRLAAGTIELRYPLSSPLHVAQLGVAAFADAGAVYAAHSSMADARFDRGIGGGVFIAAPLLSLRLDVAHGLSAGTRAHVTFGLRF